MTYDDGALSVYTVTDSADPGKKPVYHLELKSGPHYFRHETLGVTRYYQALQADQSISDVVCIPDWQNVKTTDIVIIDDGGHVVQWEWDRFDLIDDVITYVDGEKEEAVSGFSVFTVSMVQPTYDDDGLKMDKITLERIDQRYELPG